MSKLKKIIITWIVDKLRTYMSNHNIYIICLERQALIPFGKSKIHPICKQRVDEYISTKESAS